MKIRNDNVNVVTARRQCSILLLTVLEAVLNDQTEAKLLHKSTARYIYDCVKNSAREWGFIE